MDKKFRQRLETLFADLEHLDSDPHSAEARFRGELDNIRARLRQLEAEIAESETYGQSSSSAFRFSSLPILYEADRAVYRYQGGEVLAVRDWSPASRGNGKIITVPLMAGEQSIGELEIEPPAGRAWTTDERDLLKAVAHQVSLQIQNLRLLEAAERARAEAQEATRRFIHEGWDSFLDAIQRSERLGYAYDRASLRLCENPLSPDENYQETITTLDEQVGVLALKPDPGRPLSEDDKALIRAVSRQVAQQVENLRLLADASRARAEAESAARRLSRENWETYMAQTEAQLGFAYGMNEVVPLGDAPSLQNLDYSQPLTVRGETIGHLSIVGRNQVTTEEADLLGKIAERLSLHIETLRLTEEVQRRARELQELDRLKSSFLANMSHELRTPLNSILGFTDVMLEGLDGPLTETMTNDLKLIQKNGQHLLHLINDVLDMAKIEAGRMNLNPETFQLIDLLKEVVNLTSSLASERNNALFIEPDSDLAIEIHADRTRLMQVMLNLINNAIKFTERGKISICAERRYQTALITVRDTGIGIPPEKLEEIFKEFTQVDTSTTRRAGGTGLGLPISRKLIEMHGGRLWAESTGVPGEGSTFFVELPLKAVIAESEKAQK